jgi:hypothetical protein
MIILYYNFKLNSSIFDTILKKGTSTIYYLRLKNFYSLCICKIFCRIKRDGNIKYNLIKYV